MNTQIPRTAFILGLAGLIPFFCAALMSIVTSGDLQNRSVFALGAYAAVILSFLGGIKWGILLNDTALFKAWSPIVLSVLPSILAWVSLLLPPGLMLTVLIGGLLFQYSLDIKSVRTQHLPEWFGRLRVILTTGAVFSLLVGLLSLWNFFK